MATEKICAIHPKASRTDAEYVSTVEPSIAPRTQISRRMQFTVLHMQHPNAEHVTAREPNTDAEHVSTVEPSIASRANAASPEGSIRVLHMQH